MPFRIVQIRQSLGRSLARLPGLIAILLILTGSHPVWADMGRILTQEVPVIEEMQRAIILHNLQEEVLILSTDLVGPQPSTILRFIPFPSEPAVTIAQGAPFEAAFELIKAHELQFLSHTKGRKAMGDPSSRPPAPVEIHFHTQQDAHDITVVRIDDVNGFGQWVRKFLHEKGLGLTEDFGKVEAVASDYVKRGKRYFVFDLVKAPQEPRSVKPVVYRFKSPLLYYPLKTSNTFGGEGGIDLIVISPVTPCDPETNLALYAKGKLQFCLKALGGNTPFGVQASTSAGISVKEAESLLDQGAGFFKGDERLFLQLIRYHGKYVFDDDIVVDISHAPREALGPSKESLDRMLERDFLHREWQKTSQQLAATQEEAPDKRCFLLPDRGPCEAHMEVYYYDPFEGACKPFFWGGCGGVVPFRSLEECERACGSLIRLDVEGLGSGSPWQSKPLLVRSGENNISISLKKELLQATMAAIEMEIDRYENKLRAAREGPGDPANIPVLEARIQELQRERIRYEKMDPAAYSLPQRVEVRVRPSHPYEQGTLLEQEDQTRSGPFYHVAGVRGGDYRPIRPGKRYRMTLYLVYPRDYPFPSSYVYISDF